MGVHSVHLHVIYLVHNDAFRLFSQLNRDKLKRARIHFAINKSQVCFDSILEYTNRVRDSSKYPW